MVLPPPANPLAMTGQGLSEKETSWSPGAEEDGSRTRSTSGTLTPIATANGTLSDETGSQTSKNKSDQGDSRLPNSVGGHHKRHTSVLSHLRRRRCRNTSSTSQDDSEVSNEEGDFYESDAENGITSDISETGSVHGSDGSLTEHDEEEDEEEPGNELAISLSDNPPPPSVEDTEQEIILECDKGSSEVVHTERPDHQLKWWESLEFLQHESFLLALIKMLSHWLTCHPDILSACAQSTHSLWKHFADLLNLLIKAESSLLNTEDSLSSYLSKLKCPRPTSDASNNGGGGDSINNNNHEDLTERDVSRAVRNWSWCEMLPEDIELQQLPFLVSQRNASANQNNIGRLQAEFTFKNGVANVGLLASVSGQQVKKCKQVFGRIQCLLHFGLAHSFPSQHPTKTQTHSNYMGKNGYNKMPKVDSQYQLFNYDPIEKSFTVYEPSQSDLSSQNKPVQNKSNKNNNYENASSVDQDSASDLDGQRKQLMRNMAHLWLKAEVQDLEGRTGSTRGGGKTGGHPGQGHRHNHYPLGRREGGLQGGCLPPYLVPDTGALCHQLPALKQLLSARRFIIILPSCVVSSLDELKRQSAYAREAIRWIEAELRAGSRFLRPQKTQERMSLMPMKYPKRKEKEAWDFFQVLECCNFLNKNHSQGRGNSAPLVTLVTGGNQFLPPNAAAVASSAGISMESVEDFLNKWRNSLKS